MWGVFVLGSLFMIVNAHNDKIQNEANMQSSLMPQELNPAFVSGKEPWSSLMPLPRTRRDLMDKVDFGLGYQLKKYSRITACIVLVLSAVMEIILYLLDSQMT